jgi:predicted transcriptional regulator
MDERGARQKKHPGVPISLRAEVEVVNDPELARHQVRALRNFLLALSSRVGESTSYVHVGDKGEGLERLTGPLEAQVVQVVWAAKAPVSVRQVLTELNQGRPTPLSYTTVPTVMARLARKEVLARSRQARVDLYRAVASDAAGIAVSRLLAQFGESVVEPFVEQVCRERRLRSVLRGAVSRRC